MVYFEGGDLQTLSQNEKEGLIAAASAVREMPTVEIVSHELGASGWPTHRFSSRLLRTPS